MIGQLSILGKDKVETAIDRLRRFEPKDGYYLAFSGGKDSVTIKALADMAGVKYTAHYSVTTVDPPELVQFVKTFEDVEMVIPRYKDGSAVSMWNLIPKKRMPPTRLVRFCCEYFKEQEGDGEAVVTGVRWAESVRRRQNRASLEIGEKNGLEEKMALYDADEEGAEMLVVGKPRWHLNPIIDWEDDDVWEFIKSNHIPYCSLYDEGFTRLGCIGCPMVGGVKQKEQFKRWPKYRENYVRTFDRLLEARREAGLKNNGQASSWVDGESVMEWWTSTR